MQVELVRVDQDVASVFVATLADGSEVELVESRQPPIPREEKWVLIVSTLRGCPYACAFCDAGGNYAGRLSADEILEQIDYLITRRYPDRIVPVPKLKIQLARMGEPALNDAVLEVLERLPGHLEAPGLMPSLSTIAPRGREPFFERLLAIKNELYSGGRFQMQISVHTTDDSARAELNSAKTWDLDQIGAYCTRFCSPGDRKVTLNFATPEGFPLEPERLAAACQPDSCLVKLTPINPTRSARARGLVGVIDPAEPAACEAIADRFRAVGFDTLVSVGELRENDIGSNCGMLVQERTRARRGAIERRPPPFAVPGRTRSA
jgi:23S rRNA (adenine2503-C2)-methyltransferase